MPKYFAHSTKDEARENWQSLSEHLSGVAELAEKFAASFGCGGAAHLTGLLHDLGKYTDAFQARLNGAKVSVDHATAGAVIVQQLAQNKSERQFAEVLAYAIAGHHAGLPDMSGGSGISLKDRLADFFSREPLDPVWQTEISPQTNDIIPSLDFDKSRFAFQLGFLGRMIFSCLVDADYLDTEMFYSKVEGREIDRKWPSLGERIDGLIASFDTYMAEKQSKSCESEVNHLRGDILEHARKKASMPPGLFTLTVPTGGGKTLASLGFALDHAKQHGLERIIYAIPFTSIIDQTASIFRDVLGEDVLLEHHSAMDEERNAARESREKLKLAMENWAAPVVVTTNVQLFESLFASRPSRCRKLHNIANSVIVLDEAQTIPLAYLRPCVAALEELTRNYGVSIIFCTATQPALAVPEFEGGLTLLPERELAPDPRHLSCALRRVHLRHAGDIDDDALIKELTEEEQGLVIVNSRAHALSLFRRANGAGLEGLVHLTTRQYAAHRRAILSGVRTQLKDGLPCRVIATSLVEAGVDLDFPRVWRAEAGLDQIMQAAGRCNREGTRDPERSVVTIFRAPNNPPPDEIKQFAAAFARMAAQHDDWLSLDAMTAYFREVYWVRGEGLDKKKILAAFKTHAAGTDFAYRTVAEDFRMIESGLAPIIVARDLAAKAALKRLSFPKTSPGGVARDLQPYVVQVPPKARDLLIESGQVAFAGDDRFGDQFAVLRQDNLYFDDVGLLWEDAEYIGLGQAIF